MWVGLVIVSALLMGETITTLEAVGYSGLLFFFALYTSVKAQEGVQKSKQTPLQHPSDAPSAVPLCSGESPSEQEATPLTRTHARQDSV